MNFAVLPIPKKVRDRSLPRVASSEDDRTQAQEHNWAIVKRKHEQYKTKILRSYSILRPFTCSSIFLLFPRRSDSHRVQGGGTGQGYEKRAQV